MCMSIKIPDYIEIVYISYIWYLVQSVDSRTYYLLSAAVVPSTGIDYEHRYAVSLSVFFITLDIGAYSVCIHYSAVLYFMHRTGPVQCVNICLLY